MLDRYLYYTRLTELSDQEMAWLQQTLGESAPSVDYALRDAARELTISPAEGPTDTDLADIERLLTVFLQQFRPLVRVLVNWASVDYCDGRDNLEDVGQMVCTAEGCTGVAYNGYSGAVYGALPQAPDRIEPGPRVEIPHLLAFVRLESPGGACAPLPHFAAIELAPEAVTAMLGLMGLGQPQGTRPAVTRVEAEPPCTPVLLDESIMWAYDPPYDLEDVYYGAVYLAVDGLPYKNTEYHLWEASAQPVAWKLCCTGAGCWFEGSDAEGHGVCRTVDLLARPELAQILDGNLPQGRYVEVKGWK